MKNKTSTLTGLVLSLCVFLLIGCTGKTVLQGKVVIAQQKLPHLVNHNIYLTRNNRMAYSAKIDNFGFFEFTGVKRNRSYFIEFDSLPKALEGSVFYIANMAGKKLKEIDLRKGFQFQLLPLEFDGFAS